MGRPALRLRAGPGRDHRAHGDLAHGHRRQPRPVGRLALSRPGDHRALPDHHLRRRAAVPGRPRARRGRDRPPAGDLFRALSRRPGRRDRPAEGRARNGGAVRGPFDPLADPAPVRRAAAELQHRHEQRRELRRRAGRRHRSPVRRLAVLQHRRRPLQGRLDHPPLRPPRGRRPRRADGAGLPRLHGRPGRAADRGELAHALRPGQGRADARRPERHLEGLHRLRRSSSRRGVGGGGRPRAPPPPRGGEGRGRGASARRHPMASAPLAPFPKHPAFAPTQPSPIEGEGA